MAIKVAQDSGVTDSDTTTYNEHALNCVIVDDENQCIRALQGMLERHTPEVNVVKTYNNGLDFLDEMVDLNIDFMFLDIEMPNIKGHELAPQCIDKNIPVIFCSAYQEYILAALRLSASDFILKPVAKDELISAVARIKDTIAKQKISNERLEILTNLLNENDKEAKVAISTSDYFIVVNVDEILYCKSDSNYCWYVLKDGTKHLVSTTLKSTEQNLKQLGFIRVHQSYLVNTFHIEQVKKADGGSVLLSNSEEINISRRNRTKVFDYLLKK